MLFVINVTNVINSSQLQIDILQLFLTTANLYLAFATISTNNACSLSLICN